MPVFAVLTTISFAHFVLVVGNNAGYRTWSTNIKSKKWWYKYGFLRSCKNILQTLQTLFCCVMLTKQLYTCRHHRAHNKWELRLLHQKKITGLFRQYRLRLNEGSFIARRRQLSVPSAQRFNTTAPVSASSSVVRRERQERRWLRLDRQTLIAAMIKYLSPLLYIGSTNSYWRDTPNDRTCQARKFPQNDKV